MGIRNYYAVLECTNKGRSVLSGPIVFYVCGYLTIGVES